MIARIPASAAALLVLIGTALVYWALTGLGALTPSGKVQGTIKPL